ncbi:aminopeptidase [Candidatus Fermentibacteria bacterium]|nr:aminopeptidase [Candidatus Fermentibacteria bacterium]
MRDPRLERMARVLTQYSLELRSGDRVMINAYPRAESLVDSVFVEALQLGALPEVSLEPANLRRLYFAAASPVQMADISPRERLVADSYDAILRIGAPMNTRDLSGIPPDRLAARSTATAPLQRAWLRRAAEGTLRWTSTQFPTEAGAQDADMSLAEYEDFVFSACLLNDPDPVARWQRVHDEQERIIRFLETHSQFSVHSPSVELSYRASGRKWINSDGHHNFPSGEVFSSPEEDSMEGVAAFDFPAIVMGREITGISLEFKGGVVVKASATKGDDLLQELLRTDAGACRVGEVAIGTNYGITKFTRNILFDEKIGGTMHLAIGAAYPETGGINESAIHVDCIADLRRGEYAADGEVFYRNGAFLI